MRRIHTGFEEFFMIEGQDRSTTTTGIRYDGRMGVHGCNTTYEGTIRDMAHVYGLRTKNTGMLGSV